MKILLFDNRDSFTHIIKDYLLCQGVDVVVVDCFDLRFLCDRWLPGFSGVVISPGPGHPSESCSVNLIKYCLGEIPVLGICLGMQCMALSVGAKVFNIDIPRHAIISQVNNFSVGILSDLPKTFKAARYHSLAVDSKSLSATGFSVSSVSGDDSVVMSIEDNERRAYGVQFHPESIASEKGEMIFAKFVSML